MSDTSRPRIALLGIGLMGLRVGRRLLQAGYPVAAWNRSPAKAELLGADGASVCQSPAEATAQADITISVLENGSVVGDVLFAQGGAHFFEVVQAALGVGVVDAAFFAQLRQAASAQAYRLGGLLLI